SGAFHIAASGAAPGQAPSAVTPPYGVISLGHAADVLNAILLALPVPLLLLLGALADHSRRAPDERPGVWREPQTIFLAAAAIPSLLLAAGLVLPVAPAQDWDLSAILLLPLAVLGVEAG